MHLLCPCRSATVDDFRSSRWDYNRVGHRAISVGVGGEGANQTDLPLLRGDAGCRVHNFVKILVKFHSFCRHPREIEFIQKKFSPFEFAPNGLSDRPKPNTFPRLPNPNLLSLAIPFSSNPPSRHRLNPRSPRVVTRHYHQHRCEHHEARQETQRLDLDLPLPTSVQPELVRPRCQVAADASHSLTLLFRLLPLVFSKQRRRCNRAWGDEGLRASFPFASPVLQLHQHHRRWEGMLHQLLCV